MEQANQENKHLPVPGQTDCETVDALIPAYSLGATDPAESAFVQRYLVDCPEAAAQLAEYHRMVEALHYSAPPITPPEDLNKRLLAALPQLTSIREPGLTGSTWWRQRITVMPRVLVASVLILLLLFTGSTLYWITQLSILRGHYDQLASRLDRQTEALMMISSDNLQHIVLPGTAPGMEQNNQNAPRAVLLCDLQGEIGLLHVENLPASNQYEVWLFQGSRTVNVGTFQVDNRGSAVTIIRAPERMDSFNKIAITPLSGANRVEAPVLQGPLYTDQDPTP